MFALIKYIFDCLCLLSFFFLSIFFFFALIYFILLTNTQVTFLYQAQIIRCTLPPLLSISEMFTFIFLKKKKRRGEREEPSVLVAV